MEIINSSEIEDFGKKHSNARKPLVNWQKIALSAMWKTFVDLKNTFGSADYFKGLVIFDIGGNNYRLIARVNYDEQRIYIVEIMTHSEYDRWRQ